MKITLIPKEHIGTVWEQIAPMLEKAIAHNPGKYELIDIFSDCLTGVQALWVAFNEDTKQLYGCCTTRILEFPLSRTLLLEWIAGMEVDEWLEHGAEIMNSYAKDYGCSTMEGRGRRGWEPRLKKMGWEVTAVQYSCQVKE